MARKETASRPKLLLVDGYNVLRSGSRYRDMRNPGPNPDYDTDSFNRAREALIDDVAATSKRLSCSMGLTTNTPMAALKKSLVYALCSRVRAIPPTR